jgi:ubiquinol-cytochrome c reductase cytochrome c subunit
MIRTGPVGLALGALAAALAAGGSSAQLPPPATAAQIASGRALFVSKGCYECHGLAAQGAMGVGPPLARLRLGLPVFGAYLRRPAGQMPPYSPSLLSDSEVQGLFAYLQSLPKTRPAADITLLAPFVAAPPAAAKEVRSHQGGTSN